MLYAAERVVDGARLYVDVVEINPPLIIALNLPAVLLARVLGISDILAYRALTIATLAGALAFADWSLRWILGPGADTLRRRLVLVLAFALFVAVGNDFGQREHLLVALALPYVLLAVGRVGGRAAPAGPALAAGVLAGVGLAIKPHFLLVWAAVEGYAVWRLRAKRPSYEASGVAAFLALYLAGVALLTPQYFGVVQLLGPAYFGFGHDSFLHVLVMAPSAPVFYLAVLAWAALRREAKHRDLWTVLLVALVASFVAGAAQQKGWSYHFYPSEVFALALLALTVLDVRRPLVRPVQRVYAAVGLAALGTSVLSSVGMSISRIRHHDPVRERERAQVEALMAGLRRHAPAGGSLYMLSYTIEAGFPLVNYSGVRWASRLPCLWIIEAVYQDQLRAASPLRFHRRDQMGPAERYLNDAVYEDLTRHRPDVLMVLRHARDIPENAHPTGGLPRLFRAGSADRAEVLSRYRLAEEVDQYLLYVRAASPDQSGTAAELGAGPLRRRPDRRPRAVGKLLAADRRFFRKCRDLPAAGRWGLRPGAPPRPARGVTERSAWVGLARARRASAGRSSGGRSANRAARTLEQDGGRIAVPDGQPWSRIELVGQPALRRQQRQADVPALHHVTPSRVQVPHLDVFVEQLLAVVVGAAVDEDPLLRPCVHQVAAPDEVVEHPALQPGRARLGHRAHRKRLLVESIRDDRHAGHAPAGHRQRRSGAAPRPRRPTPACCPACSRWNTAFARRSTGSARHSGIEVQRDQRQRREREQLDVPLRDQGEGDRGQQRRASIGTVGRRRLQRQRGDHAEQRQQEDLAVDRVEVGRHELLGLPQDGAVAEEAEHVGQQPEAVRVDQAGRERDAERRGVVTRAREPGRPVGREQPPSSSSPAAYSPMRMQPKENPPCRLAQTTKSGAYGQERRAGRCARSSSEQHHDAEHGEQVGPREPVGRAQHGGDHAHQVGQQRVAAAADEEPGDQRVGEREDQPGEHGHARQSGEPVGRGVDQLAALLEGEERPARHG